MLGSLWKASPTEEDEGRVDRYVGQLKQFIRNYPIGEKVNYYPEYLEKIDFETVILGYEVNETPVYARDLVRGLDGDMVNFNFEASDDTVTAAEIASFSVIVPDTTELEQTLDYFSRAEIGKSGQFVSGHSISLVSSAAEQGPQVIDTTVIRRSNRYWLYGDWLFGTVPRSSAVETAASKRYPVVGSRQIYPCAAANAIA